MIKLLAFLVYALTWGVVEIVDITHYSIDNIAYEDLTYRGLFIDNNLTIDVPIAELNGLTLREVFEDSSILDDYQLVTNGDFSDGTTGWQSYGGVGSIVNGGFVSTGDGTNNTVTTGISSGYFIDMLPSSKLNISSKATVTNSLCTSLSLIVAYYQDSSYITETNIKIQVNPVQDTEYDLSTIFTTRSINDYNKIRIYVRAVYPDVTSADTSVHITDYVYTFNISDLIANNQYSPLYSTTFDLMSDAEIKAQMDEFVEKPYLFIDYQLLGIDNLTTSQMDYYYSLYQAITNSESLPNEVLNGFYTNDDVIIDLSIFDVEPTIEQINTMLVYFESYVDNYQYDYDILSLSETQIALIWIFFLFDLGLFIIVRKYI